jgi:dihydrofolate synthase/folylpolyglutamate synthase
MTQPGSDIILQRMMSLHPKIIDLTLDRMWHLLAALDHPERSLPPVIHIAGTNGKGSTQAMIRAGLEAAGKAVHAYTSPHLARFHERIRLAGTLITEDELTATLDECVTANGNTNITYFEITTIAALLAFSRTEADYTLLEVGLGGQFDGPLERLGSVLALVGRALVQDAQLQAGLLAVGTHAFSELGAIGVGF